MIEIEIGGRQFDYVMKKLKEEKKNNVLKLYDNKGKLKKEEQYIHSLDVRV